MSYLFRMVGVEFKPKSIKLLVNYWELRPAQMAGVLDDLIQKGVQEVSTYVPWQFFESDISHSLMRFLQLAYDRSIHVSLILTPELGLHYTYSGLPKDVVSPEENSARHSRGGEISVSLPPNQFVLPSLYSSEVNKRYFGYLARLNVFMSDLERSSRGILNHVTLILTGSYWKYYRAAQDESLEAYSGQTGDRSKSATLAYRQAVEEMYANPEFAYPNPAAAGRWKTQAFDEVNRRWFYQQGEDRFRMRTEKILRKNDIPVNIQHIELHTPEADPAYLYSSFLQVICDGKADFTRLSSLVDSASSRGSAFKGGSCLPYIAWTSLGPFHTLNEAEKQFLILKTLLLMGGAGGGLLIEDREWFSFSQSFRSRVEGLANSLTEASLKLSRRLFYLSSHLWTHPAASVAPTGSKHLWDFLREGAGHSAQITTSLDWACSSQELELLVVDPLIVITLERLRQLLDWAKRGRILALPKSRLYTEAAAGELQAWIKNQGKEKALDLGIPYSLYRYGSGRVVIYEGVDAELPLLEQQAAWNTFAGTLLSMADLSKDCHMGDVRLSGISLSRERNSCRGVGLFVLNGSFQPVSAELYFNNPVTVSDLASTISNEPVAASSRPVVEEGNRFKLDVPPCGILPLSVEGALLDGKERRLAELMDEETSEFAMDSAFTELSGFAEDEQGFAALKEFSADFAEDENDFRRPAAFGLNPDKGMS